ncbi:MAG: hypothetical protein OXI71_01950 [Gemmatimonadota bacterium]|nr:hypothetical protein [Gemmatimonadota bacterium]
MARVGPTQAEMVEAEVLGDRLRVAVRTCKLLGAEIDPDIVIRAAGAEFHARQDAVRYYVQVLAEQGWSRPASSLTWRLERRKAGRAGPGFPVSPFLRG